MSYARRFAMVSPNFYPRVCGVGDFSVRFALELQHRGHEVTIFSRHPVERHPEAPGLEARGVQGRLPIVIARHAADAIHTLRPTDVLIQYTPQMWDAWRFGSPAAIWLARQARHAGAKVTLIAHELFLPFHPRLDLTLAAGLQRLQFAAMLRGCDHAFVTTDTRASSVAAVCRLLGIPKPGVIRVGANALPIERRPSGRPTSPLKLGVFSTAAAGKRFDVVLEAFDQLAREFSAAELVLIGDLGPPERPLVRKIVDAVSRHPAKERIRMTGNLSLPEVADEIANLDLYFFPMESGANTRSSTLPTALGSTLPVVAVRGDDTDDALFRDGENLVFAREMSGSAFAAAALRLLRDPPFMARISAGARRLYVDHLSWEGIVDRFLVATEGDRDVAQARST
jgi:glycosyltransferase involved in cell wall biosynthesis